MSLEDDVRELAGRVARIEQELGIRLLAPQQPVAEVAPPAPRIETGRLPYLLGRALLALAGAYLLRALTESGTLPVTVGVGSGMLYAGLWLIWAARTPSTERLETALHSLASVLVLAPLLWEATVRFSAVSAWAAAAILFCFTLFGLGVSWRKDILVLATIVVLAALGTAGGLLIATHDVLPFTLAFLAIGAAVEGSACLGHWLSERWLAASAADLAVLLATWLVTNPRGLPAGYAPISHAWLLTALALLLAIYLSSTIVRTLLRGFTFTFFETAQCGVAVAITLNGCLRLSEEDPRIAPSIAALALLCAASCYLFSIVRVEQGRNFYTYSTFGILLALAGTRILMSLEAVSVLWLAMAAAAVWAGSFYGRRTLQVHGGIYLLLGLLFLGTVRQSMAALLGTSELHWHVYTGAGAAALCYIWSKAGLVRLGFAGTVVLALAAILASGLTYGYHGIFGAEAPHSYCATLRTCVLAGGSISLAWAGVHWGRVELRRLIYPTMLLAAHRLVMEDMHQERKAAAVISLLVYGAVLMALPRLLSKGSQNVTA